MARRKKVRQIPYGEIALFLLKPFVLSVFSTIAISWFVRWFFEYTMRVDGIAENIWLYWIPGFLTILFWVIFLRRRINLLDIPYASGNGEVVWHGAVILSLGLTCIFSQFYQKRGGFEEITVNQAADIDPSNWRTCYNFSTVEINKQKATGDQFSHVSGRHSDKINYEAYFLAPFGRSSDREVVYWIGKVYTKSFSNRSTEKHKQDVWQSHYQYGYQEFQNLKREKDEYLYPVQRGEDFENYKSAINRMSWREGTKHRVFEFYNGDIHSEANNMVLGSVISFFTGIIAILLFCLRGLESPKAYDNFRRGKRSYVGMERDVFEFLLLKGKSPMTAILVYLCLIAYLISAFIDGNLITLKYDRLLTYGALSKELVGEGQVWRLFSHLFLHHHIMHIFLNLIILAMIGIGIEPKLGKLKFVLIYFGAGLGSALLSMAFNDAISVGASGAIFGLLGWFISASFLHKKHFETDRGIVLLAIGYVVVSFLLGLLSMQVDNYGHLGGLLTGLVLGALVVPNAKTKRR